MAAAGGDGRYLTTEGTLECNVCLEVFNGEILQCTAGHVICDPCYKRIPAPKKCPTCNIRYPVTPIRNKALEHIAAAAQALQLIPSQAPTRGSQTAVTRNSNSSPGSSTSTATGNRHTVRCNGSPCAGGDFILGNRHACAECESYNLCERCSSAGLHTHHLMIRIPYPWHAKRVEEAIKTFRAKRRQNGSGQGNAAAVTHTPAPTASTASSSSFPVASSSSASAPSGIASHSSSQASSASGIAGPSSASLGRSWSTVSSSSSTSTVDNVDDEALTIDEDNSSEEEVITIDSSEDEGLDVEDEDSAVEDGGSADEDEDDSGDEPWASGGYLSDDDESV